MWTFFLVRTVLMVCTLLFSIYGNNDDSIAQNTFVQYVGEVPSLFTDKGAAANPPPQFPELAYLGQLPTFQNALLSQLYQKWNTTSIDMITDFVDTSNSSDPLTIMWDPPSGASSPTTLSVYVQASDPKAIIFYESNLIPNSLVPSITTSTPNLTSSVATNIRPYIQVQTPFLRNIDGTAIEPYLLRNMSLTFVAVSTHNQFLIRSQVYNLEYYVEGKARRNSTAYLVPGVQTDGWFVKFRCEMISALRAQAAIRQELADYDTTTETPDPITGVISVKRLHRIATGTYKKQLKLLHLIDLDPDLTGFDGGFPGSYLPFNTSDHRQWGILVPHHNGKAFFGKVVRINLKDMDNTSLCMQNYHMESMTADGKINVSTVDGWKYHTGKDGQRQTGWTKHEGSLNPLTANLPGLKSNVLLNPKLHSADACVTVLDLTSLHPDARGFRKGFVGYPYAYLAAGDFSVVVRLNMENFSIATTVVIDLATVDTALGGYSGGFSDGTWSCFTPYKSYAGPVGGIRSKIPADQNRLYPYYNSQMVCINQSAWELKNNTGYNLAQNMLVVDFSTIDQRLRGYSDALRVGRYVYFSPFKYSQNSYSGLFIRTVDIGTTIANLADFSSRGVHDIVDIIDLSAHDPRLQGYSGLFSVGNYIFLVPYRNQEEPQNGQKGHGLVARLDMNEISSHSQTLSVDLGWRGNSQTITAVNEPATTLGWKGLSVLDLTKTQRTQVPNASDTDLRGYYSGFGSGQYSYFVPFYNGIFSSKMSRLQALANWTLPIVVGDVNLQELNFAADRDRPYTYKGFQGGFASIWNSVY